MKCFKQPKEKGRQEGSIQGNISRSLTAGNKSIKSPVGKYQKRSVGNSVVSTLCKVLPQGGDRSKGEGLSPGTADQMPSNSKVANDKMPHSYPKIKLQLFPINENIRVGLEKDGHNPFLELTLSTKKKISSVLKHLLNKWGGSTIALGELVLFPFNIAAENLPRCRRWTSSDTGITAGDVHAVLGSPEIFRLSYGWISFQPNTSTSHYTMPDQAENVCFRNKECAFSSRNEADGTSKEGETCNEHKFTDLAERQPVPSEPLHQVAHKNKDEMKTGDYELSRSSKIENDTAVEEDPSAELFKHEEPRVDTAISMTSLLFSDLSNISIGGLLSEASLQGRFNSEDPRSGRSRLVSQPTVADSLDAFIDQFKYPQASTTISPDMPSSILDAESTCHSFSFSKLSSSSKDLPALRKRAFSGLSFDHNTASESFKSPKSEVNAQSVDGSSNDQEPKTEPLSFSLGVYNNENSIGLSSLRWNDSLGPFDLLLASRQIAKDDSISIG